MKITHIVLLGDSIFDSAPYVVKKTEVIVQLRQKLLDSWPITLKVIDGDQINDVHGQLNYLPEDSSHLILSVAGNNALSHLRIIDESVSSSAKVFRSLANIK